MRSRFFWLALAALLPCALARAELVDRIVAIIDREVVTLSEAEQASEIARARTGAAAAPLVSVVERLIESRLVEREVERFTGEPVSPELVDGALQEVRARFSSGAALPSSDVRDRGADRDLLSRRALAFGRRHSPSGALRSLGVDPPRSRGAGVQRPG